MTPATTEALAEQIDHVLGIKAALSMLPHDIPLTDDSELDTRPSRPRQPRERSGPAPRG